jgi:hypothetical protein
MIREKNMQKPKLPETTEYPDGMTITIRYSEQMDAQQRAAWRRIWTWVMAPTALSARTAGATACYPVPSLPFVDPGAI